MIKRKKLNLDQNNVITLNKNTIKELEDLRIKRRK